VTAIASFRKPPFAAALILITLVVLLELGSQVVTALFSGASTPGLGITVLAFLDGVLLYTLGLMGVALLVPEKIQVRAQGVVTLIFSILVLVGAVATIVVTLGLLFLMISLLLAIPFGTIVYLVKWGTFQTTQAEITLGLLIGLKEACVVCLLLAHQQFLQNKGLVLMTLTSFAGTILVSFLHALVPGFLVSITDAVAAIVVCILAALWAVFLLIGSIPALKGVLAR